MTELRECLERLAGDDEAERIYAAEDIGCANWTEGIAALMERLQVEPSRAVREAIFGALGQMKGEAVLAGAVELFASDDSFLRNQAVELLRARGGEALAYLEAGFASGGRDQRKFVLDVLGGLDGAGAAEIYDRALSDRDINVVITAVESLGNARKTEFRGRIQELLSAEAHPMLAGVCLEALSKIGGPESVEVARERLTGEGGIPGYLRAPYLKLLGARGGAEACGEAAAMLGDARLESHALEALTQLARRHVELRLPEEVAEPLMKIAETAKSALAVSQSIRLLGRFAGRADVLQFLGEALIEDALDFPDESEDRESDAAAGQALGEPGAAR